MKRLYIDLILVGVGVGLILLSVVHDGTINLAGTLLLGAGARGLLVVEAAAPQ